MKAERKDPEKGKIDNPDQSTVYSLEDLIPTTNVPFNGRFSETHGFVREALDILAMMYLSELGETSFQSEARDATSILSTQTGLDAYAAGIVRQEPDSLISNDLYRNGYHLGFKLNLFVTSNLKLPKDELHNFLMGYVLSRYNLHHSYSNSPHFEEGQKLGKQDLNKVNSLKYGKIEDQDEKGFLVGSAGEAPMNWKQDNHKPNDYMIGYKRGMLDFIGRKTNFTVSISDKEIPNNPVQYFAFMEGLTDTQPQENLMDFSMHTWKALDWLIADGTTPTFITEQQLKILKGKEADEKVKWYQIGKRIRTQSQEAQQ